ncbi:putative membrane protein YeiB [Blastococcus colisei]|uniref:Putative membrane protein YeiB n=1 Tax=Blastococcus colisei TaxID=1564162 RepID=A0A543PGX9_9ACTN|nr:heparan-alpha-glucosaminide N-acetyltransferase domain-containing protein [Blastococcus colisei]TQN43317.1 putative membrane protein YeiB [Blastococcus colisei]
MTHDPGTGRDRIAGLDLARGLAVLGMFGAHLGISGELSVDPASWTAVVDGRSSVLFATLAGVSVALLSGRTRPADGVDLVRARLRIAVRAAWIFAIGAVLEWLDTFVAIILGVYAVLFVLAWPFLRWSPRRLLAAAGVVAVAGPPLNAFLGQVLSVADAESHYVAELLVTGTYPAMLWLAFLLAGLAVGRLDLAATGVRAQLAGLGAAAAVVGYGGGWLSTRALAGGVPSSGPEEGFASPVGEWEPAWLTGAEPHSGTTFEIVGSTGFAVLVIAGCLVLADLVPVLVAPLAAVGALALSVYSAHIVVIWALTAVDPAAAQGLGDWVLFALCATATATVWRARLGRGPLERLLTWSSTRAAAVHPPG